MKRNVLFIYYLLLSFRAYSGVIPLDSSFVQPASQDKSHASATLTVRSSPDSVFIYIDTLLIARTPIDSVIVQEGTHVIVAVHPDADIWEYQSMRETLSVHPSEHIFRTFNFPPVYHITSTPFDAAVEFGDSIVGSTPLLLVMNDDKKDVKVFKEGYEPASILLEAGRPEIHVQLTPLTGAVNTSRSIYLANIQSKNNFPVYLSTGTTVLTGVLAAYCKIKADSYYADYQRSGDPLTLNRVKTMDAVSGVSLAASEISLLVLSYFLMSR